MEHEEINPNRSKADFHENEKKSDSPYFTELSDSLLSKSICSANDCTGLMPAPPASEAELEAYEEMYRFVTGCADKSAAPAKAEQADHSRAHSREDIVTRQLPR